MPTGLDGNPEPILSPERTAVLEAIASEVSSLDANPHVLIAVDGASGTGKSTLADELANALIASGLRCVRASIDSFHRPRAERYRRGPSSPEGYYFDSHDLIAFRTELLDPFRHHQTSFRAAVFD